ncbi:MAG: transcriptional repressor [Polyangiaceae bacterium]|nr:transcriptional repressor [Polyangiaceae bacterium]
MVKRAEAKGAGELRAALRAAGLRATPSRVAVLGLLSSASAPVSHGDAAAALEGGGWDRATLYRNLLDLTRAGLARRDDLGDHVWRFELARGHDVTLHPHFVCDECGEVSCLDGAVVVMPRGAAAPRALRTGGVEVHVKGRCDGCA